MKQLLASVDVNGRDVFEIPPCDHINTYVLAAATAQTVTVPAKATRVNFSATDDFYVRWYGSPAAIPGTNVIDGTGVEINPTRRTLDGLTTFSIIAPRACVVACAFYG